MNILRMIIAVAYILLAGCGGGDDAPVCYQTVYKGSCTNWGNCVKEQYEVPCNT